MIELSSFSVFVSSAANQFYFFSEVLRHYLDLRSSCGPARNVRDKTKANTVCRYTQNDIISSRTRTDIPARFVALKTRFTTMLVSIIWAILKPSKPPPIKALPRRTESSLKSSPIPSSSRGRTTPPPSWCGAVGSATRWPRARIRYGAMPKPTTRPRIRKGLSVKCASAG